MIKKKKASKLYLRKTNELFNLINTSHYVATGYYVDWLLNYNEEEKVIYLLFQGSTQKHDWHINLNFPCKVYKHQRNKLLVHRGYKKAWKSTDDIIIDSVEKLILRTGCHKIIMAGHSYGGALAMVAGEDINYRLGIKPIIITFGSPKIFFGKKTIAYVKTCFESCINYEHSNDIVPKIIWFYRNPNSFEIGKEEKKLKENFNINWHLVYKNEKYYKE